MTGDALPTAKRAEIAQKLARLTGLSADYIDRTNLRIETCVYKRVAARGTANNWTHRCAFTGIDTGRAGESRNFDPSIAAIIGPYSGS